MNSSLTHSRSFKFGRCSFTVVLNVVITFAANSELEVVGLNRGIQQLA